MQVNGVNKTTFTGYAFKVIKPTSEVLQEAAMGVKTKYGYHVLIAKAGMDGDNRMINVLEKNGQQLNKDYFISKKNYHSYVGKPIDINAIEEAQIEFNPQYAIKGESAIPSFQYDIPAVKTA